MSKKAKTNFQKQQQDPASENGLIRGITNEYSHLYIDIPGIKGRKRKLIKIDEISHIFVNAKTIFFVGLGKSEIFTMNNTTLKKIKEYICTQELSHLFIATNTYLFPIHIFSSLFTNCDFSNDSIKKILNKNGISPTRHLILTLKKQLISISRYNTKIAV